MGFKLKHETPDWVKPDATFFVTVCAQDRKQNTFCHPEMGKTVLDSIKWRNEQRLWYCELGLLMPDHAHLILNFPEQTEVSTGIRDWKSWLAKKHGIVWQRNFFDHRLRHDEIFDEKAHYILQNPVRARLIARAEDWPHIWTPGG